MTTWVSLIVAFWVGAIFGAFATDDADALLVPGFATVVTILYLAAKGLGLIT